MPRKLSAALRTRIGVSSLELRMLLFATALLMAGAMAYVWPNVKMVKLAYEYQGLQREHRILIRKNQMMEIEKNSLESLQRVESLAINQIGLRYPERGQIVTIFLDKPYEKGIQTKLEP